jgi:hypothetical protein
MGATPRVVGLLAAVAASAIAVGLSANTDGWVSFLLWTTGLVAATASLPSGTIAAPPMLASQRDRLALVLVLVVSACARLYRIETIPYGLWVDEAWTAHNAARLGHAPEFRPFGATPLLATQPHWVQTSNLYLYGCWLLEAVFGFSRLGVKMISALPGLLAPPLLYLLGRRYFGFWPSLWSSVLFALSTWHLTISRWGWDQVFATTASIGVFLLMELGFQRRSFRTHFLAGALLGLSLYTYVGARLVALAVAVVLGLTWLGTRERAVARSLVHVAFGVLMAAAPLFVFWVNHPEALSARTESISVLPWIENGNVDRLKLHVRLYAKVFHVQGDFEPRHNFPLDPLLDPLAGVLFVIGTVIAIFRWRERRSLIPMAWFAAAFAGGFLSVPAPNAYRIGAAAPACFLLAALAAEVTLERVRAHSLHRARHLVAALTLVCGVIVLRNTHRYFVTRVASPKCWLSTWNGATALLTVERFRQLHSPRRSLHFDHALRTIETETELRLAHRTFGAADPDAFLANRGPEAGPFWVNLTTATRVLSMNPGAIIFLRPETVEAYTHHLPGLRVQAISDPFGTPRAFLASGLPLPAVDGR